MRFASSSTILFRHAFLVTKKKNGFLGKVFLPIFYSVACMHVHASVCVWVCALHASMACGRKEREFTWIAYRDSVRMTAVVEGSRIRARIHELVPQPLVVGHYAQIGLGKHEWSEGQRWWTGQWCCFHGVRHTRLSRGSVGYRCISKWIWFREDVGIWVLK
jgi:hypothetical protein